MAERLCPKCGAYWQCGCVLEEWSQPLDPACSHDWVAAVAVELDDDFPEDAQALVCRLCGQYTAAVPQD